MTVQAEEDATLLYALARHVGTRVLVFVPLGRPARVLWFATPGDAAEIAPLESIGRALLDAGTGFWDGWTSQRSARFTGDPRVAALLSRSPDGEVIGALVVEKQPEQQWSTSDHALLEFAADFYRRRLTALAARPLPSARLDLAARRSQAEEVELEGGMRSAADRGELFVLYQPEIDLETGDVVAVEALTRWKHPVHGELGPDSFIALAEQSDLIQVLGAWVMEESFRDFGTWRAAGDDLAVVLRVNVSPVQLVRPGVVDAFAAALERHSVRGDQVCIELTENVAIADADTLRSALDGLRALGIQSAIDDLASGYSTLSRLRALPVELVKLDRSLVTGIVDDERAQIIVGSVVELAGRLGAGVIAEGVETAGDAAVLYELGCRSAQGHYFARPMPAADVAVFLAERGRRARPNFSPAK